MVCSQLVRVVSSSRTYYYISTTAPCTHVSLRSFNHTTPTGPISESDFFTWEALICGPKDTPFVKIPNFSLYFCPPFIEIVIISSTLTQEGGVFTAKLTFVRSDFISIIT